jgi:hypothetical protein
MTYSLAVTGLTVKDFDLLVRLKVFNIERTNQAVFAFCGYEGGSPRYTGIERHHTLLWTAHELDLVIHADSIAASEGSIAEGYLSVIPRLGLSAYNRYEASLFFSKP